MSILKAQLIRHEGISLKPYKDSVGKLTIGVGRNLDDVGITMQEAEMMLERDIAVAEMECRHEWPVLFQTEALDHTRQEVLINMCFNMGITRLKGFKKMLAAVDERRYDDAAREMLDSVWAKQVGQRALELAAQMRSGKYR